MRPCVGHSLILVVYTEGNGGTARRELEIKAGVPPLFLGIRVFVTSFLPKLGFVDTVFDRTQLFNV